MSGHRILHDMYQAPFLIRDPGASGNIVVDRYAAFCPLVSAAAETRTLAAPTKAGLRCIVGLDTDGGTVTLTVTGGYNSNDNTSIAFDDAGDFVEFTSIKEGSSYYWRVTAQEGTNAVLSFSGNVIFRGDMFFAQDAPTAEADGNQAIAAADFVNGIVVHTVTTGRTLTTPTGAEIAAVLPSNVAVGDAFRLHVITIGTGADDISTLTAGDADVTFVGNVTVGPDASTFNGYGTWIFRKTGATTFVGYRVG